ncbi:MAG: HEPN domain-containing protein [Syntrophaceae bacterium]|nr:HEPN domain-containing protein [Syntrophaceae bacterium]
MARHTGIRPLFNEHFVRTGKVSVESGRFFSRMFDFRQKGDYADFVQFEEEKIREWLGLAERFISDLDQAIEKEGLLQIEL